MIELRNIYGKTLHGNEQDPSKIPDRARLALAARRCLDAFWLNRVQLLCYTFPYVFLHLLTRIICDPHRDTGPERQSAAGYGI